MASGSEMDTEMIQIAMMSSRHTKIFMRGLNGCTMTKYLQYNGAIPDLKWPFDAHRLLRRKCMENDSL